MPALVPAINTIGIGAPYLGPWFDDANLTLAAPDTSPTGNQDLSVALTFTKNTNWLPPATGLFSLHISTTPRPRPLDRLRNPVGDPAFDPGRLIVLYTLLPEVEDRLDKLTAAIPPADGSAANNAPTRPRVRYLALQMPDNQSLWLNRILPAPQAGLTPAEVAQLFGVVLNADNTTLSNDPHPMSDMKTPGKLPLIGNFEPMMSFVAADAGIRMFAFDHRGRPLDPGAVASWWTALAAAQNDLWAPGLSANNPNEHYIAPAANAFSVHIVNAHEGNLDQPMKDRLNVNTGAGQLPVFTSQAQPVAIAFQNAPAAPTPDEAPIPRAALLPGGRHQANLQLWANTTLTRDFARVAVVDVEKQLVGQSRKAPANPTAEQTKRANDQQRVTTRVNVAQSTAPALIANIDGAAGAALAVIGGNAAQVVAEVLDPDWGPLPGLPAAAPPPPLPFPATLPQMTITALSGGDGNANVIPKLGQRVLVQMSGLAAGLNGYWLRAWPVGFDLATGDRIAMTGGAGMINQGNVSLVVELPDGAGTGQLGIRFSITAPGGATRDYTEQRFTRPQQAGGGSNGVAWSGGPNPVILCEQGTTGPAANGTIASGTTVVEQAGNAFNLIDRSTIPKAAFTGVTAFSSLTAGVIELTQPAFKGIADGVVGTVVGMGNAWNGAVLNRVSRVGLGPFTTDGQPFASQERLENLCATRAAGKAVVWTAPALSRYHEMGPHNEGHPGVPASIEIHGTGVALNGPAAFLVAEHAEDRISKGGAALVTATQGAPAAPNAPAGATIWAAALRTIAASMEGEHKFGDTVISPADATKAYTFEPIDNASTRNYETTPAQASDIKKWYDDNFVTALLGMSLIGTPLPNSNPAWTATQTNAVKRAMDRRALEAAWGLREAMQSISAAFARAEDFVYIETPALDMATIGPDSDKVLKKLIDRLNDNQHLRVILCIPSRLMPGWPKSIELIRNKDTLAAIRNLTSAGKERVAVFSPSSGQGREVRLSSTTVIVDDAYAITGTSHLWRRGMSYDSSLSVAIFDEALNTGRPADIVAFRRALIAGQLGLPANRVPDDPIALVEIIQLYNKLGSARVGQTALKQPKLADDPPGNGWKSDDGWNPDGSYKPDASILDLLHAFLVTNQQALPENEREVL